MTLAFHFKDTPPQRWLDQLHELNIPYLWDVHLNPQQRTNLINKAKNELKIWRDGLKDQMDAIRKRYGNDQKEELSLMLAPYEKLEGLGRDLSTAIVDLESKMRAGRPIPMGFTFGETIYGSLDSGRWFFGELADSRRFEQFERIERRYFDLELEYQRQAQEVKVSIQRVKDLQQEIKEKIKRYSRRKGWFFITARVLLVLGIVSFSLWMVYLSFTSEAPLAPGRISNVAFGGIMAIIATAGAIMAVVFARRRRRIMTELRGDISAMKQRLKQAKAEAQLQKRHFYPTQETFRKVTAEYRELKASFGL